MGRGKFKSSRNAMAEDFAAKLSPVLNTVGYIAATCKKKLPIHWAAG
ncbi:hypothetical protein HMPREF9098_0129 [Kingella denitrificans ATCC 33394]|jgi:hypothetical protein|uniref:Uncharacterized protein n=1 Tax=Kingella denitrificans ATCC 33394 TaxID=888741 RepID=F0EW95_9NEIS|nr:hypothetical protein HMPREF9098_0129 [Kingella denitrificans ATCC 33394]